MIYVPSFINQSLIEFYSFPGDVLLSESVCEREREREGETEREGERE